MSDEAAHSADLPDTRQSARRLLLLKGVLMALAVVPAGLVYAWLPDGWWRYIGFGAVVAILLQAMAHVDRASSARGVRVRIPQWVALLISGLTAVAVAALTDHFIARYLALAVAAVAVMVVWAVVGWWVGR
jgi:hypothetical protein